VAVQKIIERFLINQIGSPRHILGNERESSYGINSGNRSFVTTGKLPLHVTEPVCNGQNCTQGLKLFGLVSYRPPVTAKLHLFFKCTVLPLICVLKINICQIKILLAVHLKRRTYRMIPLSILLRISSDSPLK
jgi:hypothetical protein